MQKIDLSDGLDPLSDKRRFVAPHKTYCSALLLDSNQNNTVKAQSKQFRNMGLSEVEDNNQIQESLVEPANDQTGCMDTLRHNLDSYSPREVICCNLSGYIISILIFWLIIVFKKVVSYDSSDVEGTCRGIYSNLGYFPFTNFTITPNCSDGFEELQLGQWAGTQSLCYLSDGTINTENARKSTRCSGYYDSIDAQPYTKWKGSSICVKRVSAVINNTISCPPGYTRCNNDMCIYGSICPITDLEFSSNPYDQNETTGSARTNFGVYLNFKRELQKSPVGVLRVSIRKDLPCLNMDEYSKQIDYAAIKVKGYGCSKYGVFPNYQRIDNDTAEKMFVLQPWAAKALQLPQFNKTLQNQSAYLTYAPRLELKDSTYCKSLDLESLVDGSSNLNAASTATTKLLYYVILVIFVPAFVAPFIKLSENGKGAMVSLLICCALMGIVLTIGATIISNQTLRSRSVLDNVQEISTNECFLDKKAQKALTDYISVCGSVKGMQITWVVATCVNWIWMALLLFAFYLKFWKAN